MTREEAIAVLSTYDMSEDNDDTEFKCAVAMAIQALSQECVGSTQKHVGNALEMRCEDAIDREYLFKVLDDFCGHDRTATITLDTLADLVYDMPSVTQKSGKWIKVKSGDKDFPESIVCSRCSNENSHLDFNENAEPIGKVFVTSKYCPNCGCRMVEPQERSDKE